MITLNNGTKMDCGNVKVFLIFLTFPTRSFMRDWIFYYRISSNKRRGAYLIFVILGAALIRGRRLKEGGAYFEI